MKFSVLVEFCIQLALWGTLAVCAACDDGQTTGTADAVDAGDDVGGDPVEAGDDIGLDLAIDLADATDVTDAPDDTVSDDLADGGLQDGCLVTETVEVCPGRIHFGHVLVGNETSENVVIRNAGATDVTIHELSIVDVFYGEHFDAAASPSAAGPPPVQLRAGETYEVTVTFAPLEGRGEQMAELRALSAPRETILGIPLVGIAVPTSGIFVALEWDVGADYDIHGRDMDLHLLHPNGWWNAMPWDCYWMNAGPTWGDGGCRLRADTGKGEFAYVFDPEPVVYSVGAIYYKDNAELGPVDAQVHVYLDGVEAGHQVAEQLDVGEFWDVARIDRSSREVTPVDEITVGFPEQ